MKDFFSILFLFYILFHYIAILFHDILFHYGSSKDFFKKYAFIYLAAQGLS